MKLFILLFFFVTIFYPESVTTASQSPSNLVATLISPDEVQLTWQDNSDSETGFTVYESVTLCFPYGHCSGYYDLPIKLPANTMIHLRKITPCGTYSYRIKADGILGESLGASIVIGTCSPEVTPPYPAETVTLTSIPSGTPTPIPSTNTPMPTFTATNTLDPCIPTPTRTPYSGSTPGGGNEFRNDICITPLSPTKTSTNAPLHTATQTSIMMEESQTSSPTTQVAIETATATPFPTETSDPLILLLNGGFESAGMTSKLAQSWNVKNPSNSARKCNTETRTAARTGTCTGQFKGKASFKQKVSTVSQGTLTLSGWVKAKRFNGEGVIVLRVRYSDQPTEKLNLAIENGTYDYRYLNKSLTLNGAVTDIQVQIRFKNGSGKFWVDDVSLVSLQ